MSKATIVRWILTLPLMVAVWRNSHWSVALLLTALIINTELEALLLHKLIRELNK